MSDVRLETVRDFLRYSKTVNFNKLFDDDGTYYYVGTANSGSASSEAVWSIKRLEIANGTITWADGNSDFSQIWDNRTSLSYS